MKKIYLLLSLLLASATVSAQLEWRALTSLTPNNTTNRFDDVFFLNDNLGWAANGAAAAIYKTVDGGENWTLQLAEQTPQLPGNHYFRNVEFLNENIGFVGTLNNKFLKTGDGGTTWTIVNNIPTNPTAICGIDCVGESTIYGCGAYFSTNAFIIKSTDSGATWQYINMGQYAQALVEILFVDENMGYASGKGPNGAIIIKTMDGGATWTEIFNSNLAGEYVWKLQILASNPNCIFGSVESIAPNTGKLIRTLDNGVTWTSHNIPDPDIQAVGFITEEHGWMGGHASPILETIDGGATWTDVGVGSNLNRIFILHDDLAYASGTTIYKFSDAPLASKAFTERPRTLLKAAVNPNPVKDKLSVTIEFTESDHVVLELYDVTGKRIKELQRDDVKGASKQTYHFDFPFRPGTYFVNIHTNTGRQSLQFVK